MNHPSTPRPRSLALLPTLLALLALGAGLAAAPLVAIDGGTHEPFYPVAGEGPIEVEPFEIQAHAVTNADYLAFVRDHPEWDRGAPPSVFADPGYLGGWGGPSDLGDADLDAPVTRVSWFAAGAYCAAAGMRLPSEAEWELVARADATRRDASGDPAWSAQLLSLYTGIGGAPRAVAQGEPNVHGVHDLHGLVWEWVEDPWGVMATNDSRNSDDDRVSLVCGGASRGASDRSDYPAFMRHATRAGLGAASLGAHLGFRCAQ